MLKEKRCCHCGLVKSADEFGKDKRYPTGLKSRCKQCQREYNIEYYKKNKEKANKNFKEYYKKNKDKLRKDSLRYWREHKEERTKYSKEYRSQDHVKARHAAYMRQDRQARPEHYQEWSRNYHQNNEEKVKKWSRASYLRHREKRLRDVKKYRKNNLEKILQWNRNRKARQLEVPGEFTKEQWGELCLFFDGICPCCGEEKKLTADHIIPLSWPKTTNYITNIQPLCRSCNCSKSDNHATDYRPEFVKKWAEEQP